MRTVPRGRGGFAADYYGIFYHGVASTHLDALCHTWDEAGMWNGRDPRKEITFEGATFGSVDRWSEGIFTRGVLLDVPRHRGSPHVTQDEPVHGWELEEICRARGTRLEPGDAVCVYSGREAWQAAHLSVSALFDGAASKEIDGPCRPAFKQIGSPNQNHGHPGCG
jgi:hypothetical protein